MSDLKETEIGYIPSDWKVGRVKNIVAKEKYSCVGGPFGSNLVGSDYVDQPGVPVTRGNNLTNGEIRYIDDGFVFVSDKKSEELIQNTAYPGDLVFTQRGTIGQIGIIPTDSKYPKYILSQNQMNLRPDTEKADIEFLYYYFLSHPAQYIIRQNSIGSTIPGFNLTQLRNFPIPLPKIEEQKGISRILSTLDKKITLLQRQNQTLEKIAQTLFKHWFIDFEFPNEVGKPYWSSGGAMEASEFGEVPVGWYGSEIGKIVNTLGGGTPSTKELEYWFEGDIHWYSPTDLTKNGDLFSLTSERKITTAGLNKSSAKLFSPYSIMMTSRATVGEIAINAEEASTNQGFITIIPNDKLPLGFLLGWLKTQLRKVHSLASGSTFPELSKGDFREFEVLIPKSEVIRSYETTVLPILQKIENNTRQVQSLIKTRDTLLPKLMSGQIRIKDFEKEIT